MGSGRASTSALLDPAEPVDGRPVEGHALLEGVLELGGSDAEGLGRPEDVGEPELDEADARSSTVRSTYSCWLRMLPPMSLAGRARRSLGAETAAGRAHEHTVHSGDHERAVRQADGATTVASRGSNWSRASRTRCRTLSAGPASPRTAGRRRPDRSRRVSQGGDVQQRTPAEVLRLVKDEGIEIVDVRFVDLPGLMQHFSVPAHQLTEDVVRGGLRLRRLVDPGVPGDPGVGHAPDPRPEHGGASTPSASTRRSTSTASCTTRSPLEPYSRDPRYVAQKAEALPADDGHRRHRATSGPRPSSSSSTTSGTPRTSARPSTRSTRSRALELRADDEGPNLGYKIRPKEGYFPVPPTDHFQDLRSEMILTMERLGIEIEVQHHEVATAGQAEIDMRFDTLLVDGRQADALQVRREERGPRRRPHRDLHAQAALPGQRLGHALPPVAVERTASRSSTPRRATAGCRTSAAGTSAACSSTPAAVLAFAAPTTNSYKRLVPGYEAPVNLVYSQRNRSAACRIPLYSKSPKAKRVEFRCPDPSCNPYLAFSAMLMAGLDGVQNRIEPPDPVDKDLYDLPPEELAKVPQVPGSLDEALRRARGRPDFLKAGGVFTDDLIETWIDYKRLQRGRRHPARPHPWEFMLYYDI